MARRTAPTFETRLRQALAGENIDALLAVLDSRRKTYAGAPPVADVRLAQRLIVAHSHSHTHTLWPDHPRHCPVVSGAARHRTHRQLERNGMEHRHRGQCTVSDRTSRLFPGQHVHLIGEQGRASGSRDLRGLAQRRDSGAELLWCALPSAGARVDADSNEHSDARRSAAARPMSPTAHERGMKAQRFSPTHA